QLPASSFQLPASSFQLPASSFQLPASSFQLPGQLSAVLAVRGSEPAPCRSSSGFRKRPV
ncbi:hypothetical protein FHR96_002464, partial [Halomonas organivorans]|nr:hypothetical protein [Halomonas organivorans]